MPDAVEIDGALGEGGGQVLRTALALSIVTGCPFRIHSIRANRRQPGLARQHAEGVRAAAAICGGRVTEAAVGTTALAFVPGSVRPGSYRFEIGTAGATSLLLHALYLPLCLADGSSSLVLGGGTHVPWSPSFEYLAHCWVPNLRRLGLELSVRLERAGFYPPGGGELHVNLHGGSRPRPVHWVEPSERPRCRGWSQQAGLRAEVAERQRAGALEVLEAAGIACPIAVGALEARSPGTAIALLAEGSDCLVCVTGLGERGKRAEVVGREAAQAFAAHLATHCPVDEHAADQLLLPLALAPGPSAFLTPRATPHLLTNARVIEAFLPVRIGTEPAASGGTRVTVQPG
ncbi:MAG TPA: RNA 3'-terminal phosphate cyclase [bacterium]|nr:RNA 3'-terminal phosphate cyclase [bacterium]